VLTPVAIGMVVRARRPGVANRLDRPVRLVSAIVLALVVAAALFKERAHIPGYVEQVGLAALAFNLASMAVGYFVPRLLNVEHRQAIAIGMEIGIHNGTLAIAIALNVLGNPLMSIPAAVYSLIMFFTATAFGMIAARRRENQLHP
jgi:BASS family bile acid:Na+ symporter